MVKQRRPKAFLLALFLAVISKAAQQQAKTQAEAILSATEVKGGLIVHVGCSDGTLTAALRASNSYLVHGLALNDESLKKARKNITAWGLYGPVSVDLLAGAHLPYADGVVNLVVSERPEKVPMEEVMRVLAPGGVAYIRRAGRWTKTVKPIPPDIDEWTHYHHGPDNNAVAADARLRPPRSIQWAAGPLWSRSHDGVPSSVAVVLSSGGRLFSVVDEGLTGQPNLPARWTLVARDAFNGTLLWKKRLQGRLPPRSVVASSTRLYLASGRGTPLQVLSSATGDIASTWPETDRTDELLLLSDAVILHRRGTRRGSPLGDDFIEARRAENGRLLWRRSVSGYVRDTLAAGKQRVLFAASGNVFCLSIHTGRELWSAEASLSRFRGGRLFLYKETVFLAAPSGLQAFSLGTGKALWKGPGVNMRLGAFGARGLVWVTTLNEHGRTFLWTPAPVVSRGFDPRTGKLVRTVEVPYLASPGHHIRCYPAKATERFILLPKRGVEFVDLAGKGHVRNDWIRGPCGHGVVPANGLLYVPPHPCFCYPGVKLTGFNAFSGEEREGAQISGPRLERGPAYGKALKAGSASPGQWPTYRHDARRSGLAGCTVSQDLALLWQQNLGGVLSQPVVASGYLVVAEKERHAVSCFDAVTGVRRWRYIAGGRIDSPPTLYRGLALFGCHDGWVYCLQLEDGALRWRFRAAPADCRIVAFNQVESVWPVPGSVLVQNDIAYTLCGRSSFLDGGIRLYALTPATGQILHTAHLKSPAPDVTKEPGRPFDMEGARSDILVSDGQDLYLFFNRFSPALELKETPPITKLGDRRVSAHLMSNAGLLDRSWFDRNFWTYSRRWPGYYFGYRAPKTGQILAFDEETTCGVHVFTTRQGHSPRFWPGRDGYELFADWNWCELVLHPTAVGREKGEGFTRSIPPRWSVKVPVRVVALVLAKPYLFIAGPPDIVPRDDPMAAFEGRLGGRLRVVSFKDGETLREYTLKEPPLFDGMIAAEGRLYIATAGGRLLCFGSQE